MSLLTSNSIICSSQHPGPTRGAGAGPNLVRWHRRAPTAAQDDRRAAARVRWHTHCAQASTAATQDASYDWQQYHQNSSQRAQRAEWAASVRSLTQGVKQRVWEEPPALDPPALLANVAVVLVGPKNPANVGSVARSLGAFECLDLRIVECRCEHTSR